MTQLNIITVDEFGQYAPEVDLSQYDAPTISGMISQASTSVSDYIGYTPFAEDIVEEVKKGFIKTNGDLVIYPAKLPIVTVSAISIFRGATSVSLTLQNAGVNKYNIDYTRRKITYPYEEITLQGSPVFTNFYSLRGLDFLTKLTYRGGWEVSDLPATIKQATVLIMRDIMGARYNQTGAVSVSQGQLSYRFGGSEQESKFWKDAKRLLNVYRRIG